MCAVLKFLDTKTGVFILSTPVFVKFVHTSIGVYKKVLFTLCQKELSFNLTVLIFCSLTLKSIE